MYNYNSYCQIKLNTFMKLQFYTITKVCIYYFNNYIFIQLFCIVLIALNNYIIETKLDQLIRLIELKIN